MVLGPIWRAQVLKRSQLRDQELTTAPRNNLIFQQHRETGQVSGLSFFYFTCDLPAPFWPIDEAPALVMTYHQQYLASRLFGSTTTTCAEVRLSHFPERLMRVALGHRIHCARLLKWAQGRNEFRVPKNVRWSCADLGHEIRADDGLSVMIYAATSALNLPVQRNPKGPPLVPPVPPTVKPAPWTRWQRAIHHSADAISAARHSRKRN
jgi:hypothetical protein